MDLPLPHRMFLLSYEPEKTRMDVNSALVRGPLLRAAAVAELCLAGLLRDRDGKVARTDATAATPLDPFLGEVLDAVPPGDTRGWFDLVDQDWHRAEGTVRDRLVAAGAITVEKTRTLWVFPSQRIEVVDLDPVRALRDRVRAGVLGEAEPGKVPLGDAALASIAIEGHVATVFWRRELRAHKPAVQALTDRVDRELPRLRKALCWSIAAHRTNATA